MYAVIRVGGQQFQAEIGKYIVTQKLPFDVGETVVLDDVLLIATDRSTTVGQPTVVGASVKAEVVDQFKGKKVVIFKYKPKHRYRRKRGHRQQYTKLLISDITPGA